MNENQKIDPSQLTQEVMSLFISHKLSLDMIYFFLTQFLSLYSQALGFDLDKIKSDLEIIYKSLPPPIEEIDDHTDKQPDCPGIE